MRDELTIFRTPVGWAAMIVRGSVLLELTFGHRTAADAIARLRPRSASATRRPAGRAALAQRIVALLEGDADELGDVEIDTSHLTPFGRRVVRACRRIGWGRTCSYAELAVAAGYPGAARAVGQVMAGNRTPLVVPCHRVLGSSGRLGGYSAPQGLALKRRLLALESALVFS